MRFSFSGGKAMIKKFISGLTVLMILLFIFSTVLAVEGIKSGSKLNKTLTKRAVKYIDVNQVRSSVMNNGTFSRHPISGNSDMEWPKGSGKYICYNAGIWIAGKVNDVIRTACSDYNVEFQPGVILEDGTSDDPSKEEYRVYKVHKDYPQGTPEGDALELDSWETWQTFAENQGAPPVSNDAGDWVGYGDEMLYAVMNDLDQSLHSGAYNTPPIGIELHLLVFAFDRSGALGNALFMQYTLINKGNGDVTDCYIGAWSDVDNGDANDDLIGFDMETGMSYCYGGKPIDNTYGDRPPALGWDFFQGPIVDAPGEVALLPDGTEIPDKKILGATSFSKYYNGHAVYRDPPYSAQGAEEVWNYLSGTQRDGSPWIDPTTGLATPFANTGDPVTGTGWLSTNENPPADIRMLTGSGPFVLAVGDTQRIVVGCLIAQGKDRLSSVAKLLFNDAELQQAYNLDFQVSSPPVAPDVVLTEKDGEILLTWGKTSEEYVQTGYEFEGYNVYIGDSPGGPWKRVATFDLSNGVLSVLDAEYDDESGLPLDAPSAFGEDRGLKYFYSFTKDYNGFTMENGRTYHVSVTSYGFGVNGVPKVLESSMVENINLFHATPHLPRPGTVLHHDYEQIIEVEHYQGTGDTAKYEIWVELWDPQNVETADYEIAFNADSSWTLYKNSVAVEGFSNSTQYGIDTNVPQTSTIYGSGLDFFIGIEADFIATDVLTYAGTSTQNPDLAAAIASSYRSGFTPNDLAVNDGRFRKGTTDPSIIYNNLEIRFTGVMDSTSMTVTTGGQLATLAFSFGDPANLIKEHPANPNPGSRDAFMLTVPFEVWDVDRNIQLNVAFIDMKQKITDSLFVPTWAPRGECQIYIIGTEYDEQLHNIAYTGTETMATWIISFEPDAVWSTGDVIELSFPAVLPVTGEEKVISVKGEDLTLIPDRFKFSIKGPEKNVVSDAKARIDNINIYPNPYLAHTLSERGLHQEHVTFINLPERCTIRIFTIAGQIIRTLEHDDPTGTTHNWDLRNENNLPVASGYYIAHIDVPDVGEKILKMAVIFRKQRLRNL